MNNVFCGDDVCSNPTIYFDFPAFFLPFVIALFANSLFRTGICDILIPGLYQYNMEFQGVLVNSISSHPIGKNLFQPHTAIFRYLCNLCTSFAFMRHHSTSQSAT